MKYVRDYEIKTAFITMLNKLIYGYRLILTPYLKVLENSSGDEAIQRIQHLKQLIAQNSEQREALTKLMAQGYIDQILYNQETNALLLQAETYRSDIEAITIGMTGDAAKVTETNLLLHFVSHTDMLTAYSEEFFENYADHIEVMSRNEIRFVMKCGLTFTERIDDQMGHTPFGYKIENGIAVIDQPAADKLRQLYKNYLSGMSLSKAAAAAGIKTYHGTAKRLMETVHYLGDSFYPAIIDKDTYQKAQEERKRRAAALGRNNKQTQMRKLQIPTHFHMGEVTALYDNPVKQAEYLYSLIESESK